MEQERGIVIFLLISFGFHLLIAFIAFVGKVDRITDLLAVIEKVEKEIPGPTNNELKATHVETSSSTTVPRESLNEKFKLLKYSLNFYINEISYRPISKE